MDNELKQDLTRRLSQCNRGGLILVMYDIYFAYSDDAKKALEMGDDQAFKKGIENAQAGLDELIGALDFKYPITDQLFSLYSLSFLVFSADRNGATIFTRSGLMLPRFSRTEIASVRIISVLMVTAAGNLKPMST